MLFEMIESCGKLNFGREFCSYGCKHYSVCSEFCRKAGIVGVEVEPVVVNDVEEETSDFDVYEEVCNQKNQRAERRFRNAKAKNILRSRVREEGFFDQSKQEQRDEYHRSAYSLTNLQCRHQEAVFEKIMKKVKVDAYNKKVLARAKTTYQGTNFVDEDTEVYSDVAEDTETAVWPEAEMVLETMEEIVSTLKAFSENEEIMECLKENPEELEKLKEAMEGFNITF